MRADRVNVCVRDIMTPNPLTVDPAATLKDAVSIMHRYDVRHLPVTLGEDLVGIISDRDLRLHLSSEDGRVGGVAADYLERVLVEDVMARNPVALAAGAPVAEAADIFICEKIGALPVVRDERSRRLVGILSYIDLLIHLRNILRA
jgi:acetoin utilization protein AcuB